MRDSTPLSIRSGTMRFTLDLHPLRDRSGISVRRKEERFVLIDWAVRSVAIELLV